MSDKNKTVEAFIKKMYDLSFSPRAKTYSELDLKTIALETGMSESEWEQSRESFRKKKTAGKTHLLHANYDDAIVAFNAAKELNPIDFDVILGLAKAYKMKADLSQDVQDYLFAQNYAQICTDLKPKNSEAYELLSNIKKIEQSAITGRKKMFKASAIVVGIIFIVFFASYVSIQNTATEKQEKVAAKWGQVELVYQRRANLVPQLVSTVNAAADFERETLERVIQARSEATYSSVNKNKLSQNGLSKYLEKQNKLGGALSQLLAVSESYPELKSLSNFRDLQAQIEGSENRITVESRRYNEAVHEYNAYIKKVPQRWLDFEPIGYIKTEKSSFETPAIEL
ncbi:MAG: LemA family protein [Bacteroidota bacterium]|nr:LemA family protein [Bacteroidota bacterium]